MQADRIGIRLVSWNVHGLPFTHRRRRFRAVLQEVGSRRPDAVLLQEVWSEVDGLELTRDLTRAGYRLCVRQESAWRRPPGGLLTFILEEQTPWRLERAAFERFRASASRWRIWEGDGAARKGMQMVVLGHDAGMTLAIVHLHLQSQYPGRPFADVRAAQLSQVEAALETLAPETVPLVAGDLNTEPVDPVLARFLGRSQLRDLTAPLRVQCGCPSYLGRPAAWFDYVLGRNTATWRVDAAVDLIRNRVADDPYSDHEGLDATVNLERDVVSATPLERMNSIDRRTCLRILAASAIRRASAGETS